MDGWKDLQLRDNPFVFRPPYKSDPSLCCYKSKSAPEWDHSFGFWPSLSPAPRIAFTLLSPLTAFTIMSVNIYHPVKKGSFVSRFLGLRPLGALPMKGTPLPGAEGSASSTEQCVDSEAAFHQFTFPGTELNFISYFLNKVCSMRRLFKDMWLGLWAPRWRIPDVVAYRISVFLNWGPPGRAVAENQYLCLCV